MVVSKVANWARSKPVIKKTLRPFYNGYWRYKTAKDLTKRPSGETFLYTDEREEPYLSDLKSQLCTVSQCVDPVYAQWCKVMKTPPTLSRKKWEYVYILEALKQNGKLTTGTKGLGFGCGKEPLAAIMAEHGCSVLATDLPKAESAAKGWIDTSQHSSNMDELRFAEICDEKVFQKNVRFQPVNMNDIPDNLTGFDFVWSACALEHLGSLQHGLDFIERSMKCLSAGGVSVHTTEFNLSSNDDTFETEVCSIYRRQDIELLKDRLTSLGYRVSELNFNPGAHPVDRHIDLPPYAASPHLKLKLEGFITTSMGLIIHKPF
ncbi:class I SAM-dependent methyltransferase [Endozoicomonas lisbonensis]|uniref:Methyltransferase type 11 domain-containing protein n=1 Tax=Endozoicomonas lisbonensis TaxID=3120522 RepID=A0ABV2SHX8_9GAMM